MLKEFIDFIDSSFPSIPYDKKEAAKEAIEQFKRSGKNVNYLCGNILPELSQGDIISEIPFNFFDKDGHLKTFKGRAMVVNNSCHIENKPFITLVPVLELSNSWKNLKDIKNNMIYEYMYIPDVKLSRYYIDFSMPATCEGALIKQGIEMGKITRLASLSQIGYYLLLVKLSIYLTRREDPDTYSTRKVNNM